ncbi:MULTISPECIES: TRAP transporter small permease [Neobacillus]|uniref:TRAP transporter small permease n=1 Tax=Neobacillus rhizophilus TaxID=2833579 RepID=A0A942YU89_9BACI|nr:MULTISPECIES: TRAP transporter small permease [Neobacillus]MBS4211710.1 TRAP transporter small permease [Neobacillus rhizophilus]MBU8919460.1 TRAP transporter small permease [Bacillus sp. FJAT-29953]
MHFFLKMIYKVQHTCVYISASLMAILAISIFYDVVARYIFNSPTIWANEVSTYILQFIVFFTMGCIQMEGKQLRVTFLIERLKGTPRKILEAFSAFLILPYSIVLVVYGYQYTKNAFRLGMGSPTLLEIPLWIPYSFICIGGVLLVIAAVCSVIQAWMPEQLKTERSV